MAISVVSDLVMDVVQAADPSGVLAAREKLRSSNAEYAASSLAAAGKGFEAAVTTFDSAAHRAGLGNANVTRPTAAMPEAYRNFEASVLRTFVQSMLPEDSEEVYGKGSAGEIWKGMMAEQFANAIAEAGGVGIAEQVYQSALRKEASRGVVNPSTDESDRSNATRMIDEMQRDILGIAPQQDDKA